MTDHDKARALMQSWLAIPVLLPLSCVAAILTWVVEHWCEAGDWLEIWAYGKPPRRWEPLRR